MSQFGGPPTGRDRDAGRLYAVHSRHIDVHEHEVRAQSSGFFDRIDPVPRFTTDMPVGLRLDEIPHRSPKQLVVIGNENLDRSRHLVTLSRESC